MNRQALTQRWKSGELRKAASEVVRYLLGEIDSLPQDVPTYEGRADLRGFTVPSPKPTSRLAVGDAEAAVPVNVIEIHQRTLRSLNLTGAKLDGIRFFDSEIINCCFDEASCMDWRLWNCQVEDCTFIAAKISGTRSSDPGTTDDQTHGETLISRTQISAVSSLAGGPLTHVISQIVAW